MKNLVLSLILISTVSLTYAQITVEKIKLIETVDNKYESSLPKLVSNSEGSKAVVDKINAFILDRFMIESFDQNELEEFRWYEVYFSHEIKQNFLLISFSGEYYGSYMNYIEEELFFDLNTGEQLFNTDIPFHALFSLDGYLDFMNNFWLEKAKPAFEEAIECADFEPYCSYYDINEYSINNHLIRILHGNRNCFAKVSEICTPLVILELSLDSIKIHLSDLGRKILLVDAYTSKKGIEKFLYNKSIEDILPDNRYIFGKIDGKYPISMALNFVKNSNQINGYYYYDRKLEKLKLNGLKKDNSTIELEESLNGENTGSFLFSMSKTSFRGSYSIYHLNGESTYLKGTWSSPDGTKNLTIEFTEIKMNDSN